MGLCFLHPHVFELPEPVMDCESGRGAAPVTILSRLLCRCAGLTASRTLNGSNCSGELTLSYGRRNLSGLG